MSQYKRWFKRLRLVLELSRRDVSKIMETGGLPVSASRADGWCRLDTDAKRSTQMTEAEFDAFTNGLLEWSKKENPR